MVEQLSAGAAIVNKNKVLILQEGPSRPQAGKWGPSGGHGIPGETPSQTAEREIREETHLEIRIDGIVQIVRMQIPDKESLLVVFYHATATNLDEIKIDGQEISAYHWATKEDITIGKYPMREEFLSSVLVRSLEQDPAPLDVLIEVAAKEDH